MAKTHSLHAPGMHVRFACANSCSHAIAWLLMRCAALLCGPHCMHAVMLAIVHACGYRQAVPRVSYRDDLTSIPLACCHTYELHLLTGIPAQQRVMPCPQWCVFSLICTSESSDAYTLQEAATRPFASGVSPIVLKASSTPLVPDKAANRSS